MSAGAGVMSTGAGVVSAGSGMVSARPGMVSAGSGPAGAIGGAGRSANLFLVAVLYEFLTGKTVWFVGDFTASFRTVGGAVCVPPAVALPLHVHDGHFQRGRHVQL